MDRLEEWRTFVSVATKRSFAEAARLHGRSPQAVTRAIAALEGRLGSRLLHRTTRAVSLTDEGARCLERARELLAEFEALESSAETRVDLGGALTVAAPVLFGQMHVLPILTTFLAQHSLVTARALLHDRVVSLSEEGVDVAVRIGALSDSSLRVRLVGHVSSVICASPEYLKKHRPPRDLDELEDHATIAFTGTTPVPDRWSFGAAEGKRDRVVRTRPVLTVNTAQAAIDAAVAGLGLTRVISYQVASLIAKQKLKVVLREYAPSPMPVHVVQLPGVGTRTAAAFIEYAAERLRTLLR